MLEFFNIHAFEKEDMQGIFSDLKSLPSVLGTTTLFASIRLIKALQTNVYSNSKVIPLFCQTSLVYKCKHYLIE
jgi:hypothetical protein